MSSTVALKTVAASRMAGRREMTAAQAKQLLALIEGGHKVLLKMALMTNVKKRDAIIMRAMTCAGRCNVSEPLALMNAITKVAAAREMTCQEVVQSIEGEEKTTTAFNALMKALT